MKSKKGIIEGLQALIIPLVTIGIVLVVGFLIMNEAFTQIANDSNDVSSCASAGCNGTRETIQAMQDIPGWLPIIVITVIGALLIGLVARFRAAR